MPSVHHLDGLMTMDPRDQRVQRRSQRVASHTSRDSRRSSGRGSGGGSGDGGGDGDGGGGGRGSGSKHDGSWIRMVIFAPSPLLGVVVMLVAWYTHRRNVVSY